MELSQSVIKEILYDRPEECHKGDFGYVALVGGSLEYSGAIRLAYLANAAMRAGAGVATAAAPRSICPYIISHILESTLYPLSDDSGEMIFVEDEFRRIADRYDCIAIGMGIGNTVQTQKAVRYLLENYKGILIIDADGLNALSAFPDRIRLLRESAAKVILTPHPGEFRRLQTGGESAAEFAEAAGCIVLLKGHVTTVTDGHISYQIKCGCAGMATAGSGDVLSGILAAVCAYNPDRLIEAVATGVHINGAAGELAQSQSCDITMTSADTASCVKEVIRRIRTDRI